MGVSSTTKDQDTSAKKALVKRNEELLKAKADLTAALTRIAEVEAELQLAKQAEENALEKLDSQQKYVKEVQRNTEMRLNDFITERVEADGEMSAFKERVSVHRG